MGVGGGSEENFSFGHELSPSVLNLLLELGEENDYIVSCCYHPDITQLDPNVAFSLAIMNYNLSLQSLHPKVIKRMITKKINHTYETYRSKAFELCQYASQKGVPDAYLFLGLLLETDPSLSKDQESQNQKILQAFSSSSNPKALFHFGRIHLEGIVIEKNETLAISSLRKAADQNFLPAQFLLGKHYLHSNNDKLALKYAENLVREHKNYGELLMGMIFQTSEEKQDFALALHWYYRAVRHFHVEAYQILLEISSNFGGNAENIPEWAQAEASFLLGLLFYEHHDILQILPSLIERQHTSPEIMQLQKEYILGIMVQNSPFVPEEDFKEELDQAVAFFTRAYTLGNVDASVYLALIEGEERMKVVKQHSIKDQEKTIQSGLFLLRDALEEKSPCGTYNMSRWYSKGLITESVYQSVYHFQMNTIIEPGSKKDWKSFCTRESYMLLLNAARLGYPKAQLDLACYLQDNSFPNELIKPKHPKEVDARYWLIQAAKENQEARLLLQKLEPADSLLSADMKELETFLEYNGDNRYDIKAIEEEITTHKQKSLLAISKEEKIKSFISIYHFYQKLIQKDPFKIPSVVQWLSSSPCSAFLFDGHHTPSSLEFALFELYIYTFIHLSTRIKKPSEEKKKEKKNPNRERTFYRQLSHIVESMKDQKLPCAIMATLLEAYGHPVEQCVLWWLKAASFLSTNSSPDIFDLLIPWKLSRICLNKTILEGSDEVTDSPQTQKKWLGRFAARVLEKIRSSRVTIDSSQQQEENNISTMAPKHQEANFYLHEEMKQLHNEFMDSNPLLRSCITRKENFYLPMLFLAVANQDFPAMQLLMENDAQLGITNELGATPLLCAAENKQFSVCNHLHQLERQIARERGFFQYVSHRSERELPSRFSCVVKETDAPANNETVYIFSQRQLKCSLLEISKEAPLSTYKKRILAALHALGPLRASSMTSDLKPILKRLIPPSNLIAQREVNKLTKIVQKFGKGNKFEQGSSIFAPIESYCSEIEILIGKYNSRNKPQKYGTVVDILESIVIYYRDTINHICTTKDASVPVFIHSQSIGIRTLSPDYVLELFPYYDTTKDTIVFNTSSEYGTHIIRSFRGIHFKGQPHAPGIEFIVDCLSHLVAGQISAPSELIKVFMYRHVTNGTSGIGKWKRDEMIYIASKTVAGANLEYILSNHHYLIADRLLNPKNFTAMIITSLLTNPQDGKPDNYMVELNVSESKKILEMKIIGIDNDIAFADPIVTRRKFAGEYFVNVRNVLYFFPQMDDFLNEEFRTLFLSLSPEMLILEWLRIMTQKTEEHQQLLADKLFTKDDFENLNLPITLVPGTIRKVYRKMKHIQAIIKENTCISHKELLRKTEPLLCLYYENLLISEQISCAQAEHEIILIACDRLYSMECLSKYVRMSDVIVLECGNSITVEEYLESQDIPNEFAFENNRTNSPILESELFLASIDYSLLDLQTQTQVVSTIANLKHVTALHFTHATVPLSCFLNVCQTLKYLEHVTFENCSLQNSDLHTLKSRCPHVAFSCISL